jgi:hypothetical protein
MDDVAVEDIRRFESELLDYVGHNSPELFDTLANASKLEDDMVAQLEQVVSDFKGQFAASDGSAPATPAPGTDRGANEGQTSSPQAGSQADDNPAEQSEAAADASSAAN